jgi:HAD superfamily hydrolase (TIGR01549 family)
MKEIRAIIFDCGGTILEGEMPWHEVYQEALRLARAPLGLRPMAVRYEAAIRRVTADKAAAVSSRAETMPRFSAYLAAEFGMPEERLRQAVAEVLFDHPEARLLAPVADIAEVLELLKSRGYKLGVISNWSADLPSILRAVELKLVFDGIFTSEALGFAKPNPAAFLVPLERLGLTPGVSAYVGDLYDVDVVGAREVGMTPILHDPLGLRLHPDVLAISHMSQLLDLFLGV